MAILLDMSNTEAYFGVYLRRVKIRRGILLIIFLSFFIPASIAQNKTLVMAAGSDRPPYIMESSQTGFEIELIRAVMSRLGYDIKVLAVAHTRSIEMLNQGLADIALIASRSTPKIVKLKLSN